MSAAIVLLVVLVGFVVYRIVVVSHDHKKELDRNYVFEGSRSWGSQGHRKTALPVQETTVFKFEDAVVDSRSWMNHGPEVKKYVDDLMFTGYTGYIGYTGAVGNTQGAKGVVGMTGFAGYTGYTGYTGPCRLSRREVSSHLKYVVKARAFNGIYDISTDCPDFEDVPPQGGSGVPRKPKIAVVQY